MGVFEQLHPVLRRALSRLGYREPTPVQERAIPVVLRGVHTLIVAPTGSGKTEAAMLPVLSMLLERGLDGAGVRVLYVTPLRALNRDLLRRIQGLVEACGLRVAVRHGDTGRAERRRIAAEPPEVLITTPETLQFLLVQEELREALKRVRWVIIDEVHELLDSKRGSELAVALERLARLARFQRIGLSATIGDVDLACRFLAGPYRMCEAVVVPLPRGMEVVVESPRPSRADEELAVELGISRESAARVRRIAELVRSSRGCLVFTNTRDTAEMLASRLRGVLGGEAVLVHHGSLSREERLEAEKRFREGEVKALVCTSSLELGIDIGHVDLVVQYMSPRQACKLAQRIGRSGHRLDKVPRGRVVCADSFDDVLESAVLARRAVSGDLEEQRIYEKPYDVLAHQLVGIAIEEGGRASLREVYEVVTRSYPFRDLSYDELVEVAEQLESQGLVKLRGEEVVVRGPGWKYYFETSMIPDTKKYRAVNVASRRTVGELDEEFVATSCEEGSQFILAGKPWRVVGVDHEKLEVYIEPVQATEAMLPAWEGDLIPVEWRAAREAAALLRRLASAETREERLRVLSSYPLSPEAAAKLVEVVEEQVMSGKPVPTDKDIVVEATGRVVVVHAPLGSRGCQALGLILSYLLGRRLGASIGCKSDPYRVALIFPGKANPKLVAEALMELDEERAKLVLEAALARTRLYKWKLLHVARRFGVLSRDASLKQASRLLEHLRETPIGREAVKEALTDKLDLERVAWLLRGVKEGWLRLHVVDSGEEPSPITREALSNVFLQDVVAPALPASMLVELVKRRLMEREVELYCLVCRKWSAKVKVKELPDRVTCRNCGAGFVAAMRPGTELREVFRKLERGDKLSREERDILKKAREVASLVLTYGKPAVIALVAHGIGPKTAARVAAKYREGEEAFYRAILEAEKAYARTRQYWH